MRLMAVPFPLPVALLSVAMLAACGGGSTGPLSAVPAQAPAHAALSGGSPERAAPLANCTATRRARSKAVAPPGATYLYVVDGCGNAIDVLQAGTYNELGYISVPGSYVPSDIFLDLNGNLYTNAGPAVYEYAAGNWGAPNFTYTANIKQASAVTTDRRGNVYEGDLGYINEYYQNRNVAIATCSAINAGDNGQIDGVAVDSHGNVFVNVDDFTTGSKELVEYVGGLNNCQTLTVLPVPSPAIGTGMAVDKSGNLLLPNGGTVEIVDAPSYNAINATIGSGFSCAQNVRLTRGNYLAFVTDVCKDTVTAVKYKTGANVIVLGTAYGISQPFAAVEQPNAVY